MKTNEKTEKKTEAKENRSSMQCSDRDCPVHGYLKSRGRTFEGKVIKKFPKRIVIEFGRSVYVKKYERYKKSRTKLHARLPDCIKDKINIGDFAKVQECRPLSKIIHFVAIAKTRDAEKKEEKK